MDPAVSVTDMDTPTASSLVITIPIIYSGDEYTFPDTHPLSVTMESNSSSRVVTYTGVAPIQVYLDLMLAFSYSSSLDEPGMATRGLTIQIFTPSDTPGEMLGSNVASTLIQILPVNDNSPEFSQEIYEGRIAENAPAGTPVGVTVTAQDRDNSGATDIIFASSDPFFSVDPVSGEVSSLRALDAEFAPVYELTVTANDNDGNVSLVASALVLINVTDINDERPFFDQSLYSTSVGENVSIGATLLTVSATDSDITTANSGVTYMIDTSAGGSGSGGGFMVPSTLDLPFTVDAISGAITLTRSLDFEAGVTLYEFVVVATDSGSPPLSNSTQVRVRVTDINDNPPDFDNTFFSFTLDENSLFPTDVVLITATDPDTGAGGRVIYSLQGTSTFAINPTTGLLSLVGPLDFEMNRTHVFMVIASDMGSPRLSAQENVTISVRNVNDNPPVFSQTSYTFSVPENAGFSETVSATDDDDDTLTYREVSGFVPGIELDLLFGEIFSASGFFFDFEAQRSHVLVLEALDSSFSAAANVTIVVLDANDQPPIFTQDVYTAEIDEDLPLGSSVAQVLAEDGDTMENAIVMYSLDPQGPFSINQSTGIVIISGPLDFDAGPTVYILNITARNTVPPYFEDSATVSVSLLNVNDNPPVLSLDEVNVTFVENSEPVLLTPDLIVSDGDGSSHPLTQCTVILTKACISTDITPCEEILSVNGELATQLDLSVQSLDGASEQSIIISGNGSAFLYQLLLQTLQYSNTAPEPVQGQRTITLQCQDEDFSSNTTEVSLLVQLRNEFCPVVTVFSQEFNFTEGSETLPVGLLAQFVLSDEDSRPHNTLRGLQVILGNRLDAAFESISINDSAGLQVMTRPPVGATPPPDTAGSGDDIFPATQTIMMRSMGQPSQISVFQRALRSLIYENTHPEPTVAPRIITIAPMDMMVNCSMVDLIINVLPVNDNPPDLVLSRGNTLQYLEESGALAFAAEAGLMVSDPDHNTLFPMRAATVELSGILDAMEGASEMLQYNTSALPAGVAATSSQEGTWQDRLKMGCVKNLVACPPKVTRMCGIFNSKSPPKVCHFLGALKCHLPLRKGEAHRWP